MIFVNSGQDLSAASGIINIGFLDDLYHSFMDEALVDMGRTIIIHLSPAVTEDSSAPTLPQAARYNPFFGGVSIPNVSTSRGKGTYITPRDVEYKAQIRYGPMEADQDISGMGGLTDSQARITIDIGGLQHILQAISISIENRRFAIRDNRPIGLRSRRYLMVLLQEIQEKEIPSPDLTMG